MNTNSRSVDLFKHALTGFTPVTPITSMMWKGINPDNVIPSSEDGNRKHHENDKDDSSPSPVKRRRSNRATHVSTLSYDLKHHPLDIVTQPRAFMKKLNARPGTFKKESYQSNREEHHGSPAGGSMSNDDEADKDMPPDNAKRNPNRNRVPLTIDSDEDAQHRRRSTRLSSFSNGRPLYDMSWHPADYIIRPQAIAARHKRLKQSAGNDHRYDHGGTTSANNSEENDCESKEEGNHSSSPKHEETTVSKRQTTKEQPTNAKYRRAQPDGPLPNYSASFHPADVILRPSAAAKHFALNLKQAQAPVPSILLPTTSLRAEIPPKRQVPALKALSEEASSIPTQATPQNGGELTSQHHRHTIANHRRSFCPRKKCSSNILKDFEGSRSVQGCQHA